MRRNLSLTMFCAAAIASSAALDAQAVPDSVPTDSVRPLTGITVSVPRPTTTPGGASAVVVDLDSLARGPSFSLENAIRALPLVRVRTNSRGEAQASLRGSEDRHVAVLLDGVPLSLGWDHRADLSVVPLTGARSVTLVRGLSSVLHGPNTLGGVVEVDLARTGGRASATAPLDVSVSLDGTGGTGLSMTAGRASGSERGGWDLRGGFGLHDRPGSPLASGLTGDPAIRARFLGDGDLRLNSDVRRVDGFMATRYDAPGGSWTSVSASGFHVERGVPPEAHQDEPRLWRYPRQNRLVAAVTAGTGRRASALGEGNLEGSVGLDLGSSLVEQFATEAFRTVDWREESDDRVLTVRLLGEHSLGGNADVRASATFADVAHDEVLTPGAASRYRQRLWSFGAEGSWRPGARGLTTVTAGAALDGAYTPETGDRPARGRLGDHGLRVGVRSLVRPGLLLHAGVSRRARFPSLRELYSDALGRFQPNPDLGPETLLASEAGFTARADPGELQLVGFVHRLADGITRTSVIGSDGTPRLRRVNRSGIRSRGVELLAAARLGNATLSADLTLQRVEGRDSVGAAVRQEYEPAVLGGGGIELPLFADLSSSARVRFVGRQWCENPEVGALQSLRSSRALDLGLSRVLTLGSGGPFRTWSVSAWVWNATDGVVFGQCGLPEPGRLLQLQLRVR